MCVFVISKNIKSVHALKKNQEIEVVRQNYFSLRYIIHPLLKKLSKICNLFSIFQWGFLALFMHVKQDLPKHLFWNAQIKEVQFLSFFDSSVCDVLVYKTLLNYLESKLKMI